MKEVCFIQDGLGGGGAERVIVTLCNALAERGYAVKIGLYNSNVCAYPLDEKVSICRIDENYAAQSMDVRVWRYKLEEAFWSLIKFLCTPYLSTSFLKKIEGRVKACNRYICRTLPILRFCEDHQDATIISFMIHCYNELAIAVGMQRKYRIIISERDDPTSVRDRGRILLRKKALEIADACVFQTPQAEEYLHSQIKGVSFSIPNPLSSELPAPYIGEREKTIINFCRLNEKKNLPLLIRAFERLAKEQPDYKLTVYGRGELRAELLTLIEERGLHDRVFIFDFAPNIHEIANKCAVFVSSSDFEGISNSMIEAMAMGMPVVCTDCPAGGAAMFIRNGVNGLLTPVGDEQALYEAMKYMIEHPAEAQKMGQKAAEIRDELDADAIVDKWIEVIDFVQKNKCKE